MKAWQRNKGEGRDGRDAALRSFLCFAVIAVVVAAMIIAIGEVSRTNDAGRNIAPAAMKSDPLAADLARCRDVIAEQLATDDTCRRIWAENRKRFLEPNIKPAEVR